MIGLTFAEICTCLLTLYSLSVTAFQNERDLLEHLLKDYSRMSRPVRNVDTPLDISIMYYLSNIVELDEQKQILKMGSLINVMWPDTQLNWGPGQSNLTMMSIPTEYLWKPTVDIINRAVDKKAFDLDNQLARLYLGGTVVLTVFVASETLCEVDLRYFPFDTQICSLHIATSFPSSYMRVVKSPHHEDLPVLSSGNSEWPKVTTILEEYVSSGSEEQAGVSVTIKLHRDPTFFVMYLIVPSIITSFVSVLAFALPPESGERIGLSITSMLAFTVFLLMVSDVSPRGGKNTSLLMIYITAMECLSVFELLANILVLTYFHHDDEDIPSGFVQKFVIGILGPIVGIRRKTQSKQIHPKKIDKEENGQVTTIVPFNPDDSAAVQSTQRNDLERTKDKMKDFEPGTWKLAAKILDRVFLVVGIAIVAIASLVQTVVSYSNY